MLLITVFAMAAALVLPATALAWSSKVEPAPYVASFTKNGLIAEGISFTEDDFYVQNAGKLKLSSITLNALPSGAVGALCIGNEMLEEGAVIERTALSGLRFRPLEDPADVTATFSFIPAFSDGTTGVETTATLYLLENANEAPVAENLTLNTYRDVPATGYFSAMDPEGGALTFQLTDRPARGAVSYEEGASTFVYTPYEGKTGKDSFSYVAIDEVGNVSEPAKVSIKIEKPATKVTYSDLEGSTAGVAAIRLAEEGIFTGECMGSQYFFRPDKPVSRSEFIAMAMSAAGVEPLADINVTGFSDDVSIPTWAKGYVSSALRTGLIRGMAGENGQIVFNPDSDITRAEATVLLDRVMNVTDVTSDVFYPDQDAAPAWAYQSAVNLETAGVLRTTGDGALSLGSTVTRGEAAEMLCAAIDIMEARNSKTGLFH
ncbi:MAG: S-layer homology domain-containing protein [Oscillospiraceae bacterium]|nr:S-layer homology domain-containing protein [Oscillospiraceae bacterium]